MLKYYPGCSLKELSSVLHVWLTFIIQAAQAIKIFFHSTPLSDFFWSISYLTAWQLTLINALIEDHSAYVKLSSPWQGTPLKTLMQKEMPRVLAFMIPRLPQGLSQRKIFLQKRQSKDTLRKTVRDYGLKTMKTSESKKPTFLFWKHTSKNTSITARFALCSM